MNAINAALPRASSAGDHLLDLLDSRHREALGEQQEPHPNQPNDPSRIPSRPVMLGLDQATDVVVAERRDDDHEALEPHPEVYERRDDDSAPVGADLRTRATATRSVAMIIVQAAHHIDPNARRKKCLLERLRCTRTK